MLVEEGTGLTVDCVMLCMKVRERRKEDDPSRVCLHVTILNVVQQHKINSAWPTQPFHMCHTKSHVIHPCRIYQCSFYKVDKCVKSKGK